MEHNILISILLFLLIAGSVAGACYRRFHVPKAQDGVVQNLKTTETLRLAENGYTVDVGQDGVRSVQPMPWRQIFNHLCSCEGRFRLQVMYASGDLDDDIVVHRIRADGRTDAQHSQAHPPGTICCVRMRAGPYAKAQFARRVATALQRGECRRLQLGGVIVQAAPRSDPAGGKACYLAAWDCWQSENGDPGFGSTDLPAADRQPAPFTQTASSGKSAVGRTHT